MSLTPLLIHSPGISGLISKVMGLVSVSLTSFPGGSVVKYLPGNKICGFNPWVEKIPQEKEMASHSSILAWKIPRTEEPGKAIVHGVAKESAMT